MFTFNGKWIDELPHLSHRVRLQRMQALDYRHATCWRNSRAERLLDTVYSAIKIAGLSKFNLGDSVRVSKYKTIFEKGYTSNWTIEVFTIVKI